MKANEAKPQNKIINGLKGGVGALLGVILSKLLGLALLIPAVAFIAALFILGAVTPPSRKVWHGLGAVQIGYMTWLAVSLFLLFGGYIQHGGFEYVLLAFVILNLLALVWLYIAPGLWPIIVIVLLQALALADGALQIGYGMVAEPQINAMIAHEMFRAAIILAAIAALVDYRRSEREMLSTEAVKVFD